MCLYSYIKNTIALIIANEAILNMKQDEYCIATRMNMILNPY